jgi:hypothetical protein
MLDLRRNREYQLLRDLLSHQRSVNVHFFSATPVTAISYITPTDPRRSPSGGGELEYAFTIRVPVNAELWLQIEREESALKTGAPQSPIHPPPDPPKFRPGQRVYVIVGEYVFLGVVRDDPSGERFSGWFYYVHYGGITSCIRERDLRPGEQVIPSHWQRIGRGWHLANVDDLRTW